MTDYTTDIKDFLEDEWTTTSTLTFTPVLDISSELEDWSAERRICVQEVNSTHQIQDLHNAVHLVIGLYQVDCYARDRDDSILMRDEVDRIVNATTSSSITGIKLISQSQWRESTDFGERQLYRQTCELRTYSYMNT